MSEYSVATASINILRASGSLLGTASFALTASVTLATSSISSSYAVSASYAPGAGGGPNTKVIMFCAAYTPSITGADAAEIPAPYSSDGVTPVTWSVKRLNLRVQLSGSSTSSITIQSSPSTASFSASYVGDVVLNSQSYESFSGSGATLYSGQKLRFYVNTLGTAQYWTITAEMVTL